MELLEAFETRRTTRAFKSTPVPRELIEKVLEVASRSPSYTNTQPWEVAVVTGAKRDEISRIIYEKADAGVPPNADVELPESWPTELDRRAREHSARRFKALGIERESKEQRKELRLRNYKFYGAPCVIYLLVDRSLTTWSVFDLGLFAHGLILAAHAHGLGTCLQASTVHYPDAIRECLGIPTTKRIVLCVCLGYADPGAVINAYRSLRVPVSDFAKRYA